MHASEDHMTGTSITCEVFHERVFEEVERRFLERGIVLNQRKNQTTIAHMEKMLRDVERFPFALGKVRALVRNLVLFIFVEV